MTDIESVVGEIEMLIDAKISCAVQYFARTEETYPEDQQVIGCRADLIEALKKLEGVR